MIRGFAHAPGEKGLTDTVVDLVSASVIEVFTLEKDTRPAGLMRQSFGEVQRRRPADVIFQIIVKLLLKFGVLLGLLVVLGELPQGVHERFGHKTAAIRTETALRVWQFAIFIFHFSICYYWSKY